MLVFKKRIVSSIIDNDRPPLNKITLSFASKSINKKFDASHTNRSLSFVRGSLLLAIGLYLLFAWLDPVILPEVQAEVMLIRMISCIFFIITVALTFTTWGTRNFQFLMSLVVLIAGIGIIGMVMMAESIGVYTYYAGLILAVMYAHSLLRLRFIYASLTTWSIMFFYFVIAATRGPAPFEVYVNNLFFLFSANLMGMLASYWLEYYMKDVYWKDQLLFKKTKELQKEHQRKTDELADAREMQLKMLPQQLPGCEKYLFSFSMKAASEVGGDYYDYHLIGDHTLTFGIGDATGHGLKAGIMVTAMKLIFAEHAENDDVTKFLSRASRSLRLMDLRKLYMAFAIGRLYDDERLELAGAGMPPALLYRAESNRIEKIPLKGMPLGTSVSFPYQKSETYVNPGDILMLMTDGLAESFDSEKRMFGYERIERILFEMVDSTPDQIIDRMHLESEKWLGEKSQNDDMTFFIFKRNAVEEKKESEPIHTTQMSAPLLQ